MCARSNPFPPLFSFSRPQTPLMEEPRRQTDKTETKGGHVCFAPFSSREEQDHPRQPPPRGRLFPQTAIREPPSQPRPTALRLSTPPVFSSVLSQANQSHIDGRAPSLARLRVTHHLKRRTGDDQSENLIPSLAPAEPTHRRARTHARTHARTRQLRGRCLAAYHLLCAAVKSQHDACTWGMI